MSAEVPCSKETEAPEVSVGTQDIENIVTEASVEGGSEHLWKVLGV